MLSLQGESQPWELTCSFHSSCNDTRPSYVNTSSWRSVAHMEMGLRALPCPTPQLGSAWSSLDPLPRMAVGTCSSPQSPSGFAGGGMGSPGGTSERCHCLRLCRRWEGAATGSALLAELVPPLPQPGCPEQWGWRWAGLPSDPGT